MHFVTVQLVRCDPQQITNNQVDDDKHGIYVVLDIMQYSV